MVAFLGLAFSPSATAQDLGSNFVLGSISDTVRQATGVGTEVRFTVLSSSGLNSLTTTTGSTFQVGSGMAEQIGDHNSPHAALTTVCFRFARDASGRFPSDTSNCTLQIPRSVDIAFTPALTHAGQTLQFNFIDAAGTADFLRIGVPALDIATLSPLTGVQVGSDTDSVTGGVDFPSAQTFGYSFFRCDNAPPVNVTATAAAIFSMTPRNIPGYGCVPVGTAGSATSATTVSPTPTYQTQPADAGSRIVFAVWVQQSATSYVHYASPATAAVTATPVAEGSIADFTLTVGENRELRALFSDMDDLTCEAVSDPAGVVRIANERRITGQQMGCAFSVEAVAAGEAEISVTATDPGMLSAIHTFMVTVTNPPPTESSSSSGGVVALAIIGAGAYFWWKKRQIASGNGAKMALLPDVSFDLDRNDRRAFYTKMNWQNPANSNWQLRSAFNLHTKYDGELLDWHANSHIGYRLNGKFGEFNPYLRGKFVANDPQNAEMRKTYSLGLNYQMPKRFSIQILQPDSEMARFSVKTQWYLPKGIGLQLEQPNSDLKNYGFGVQWRGKSKIRYEISGETGRNSYRLSGKFWF